MKGTPHDAATLAWMLREQIELLEAAAAGFDQGRTAHALQMATSVRVLLHDTGASHSLLGLTGHKQTMQMLDTGTRGTIGWSDDHLTVTMTATTEDGQEKQLLVGVEDGLVDKRTVNRAVVYVPRFGDYDPTRCLDIDTWSKEMFISADIFGEYKIARRGVYLYLANRVGGAHVHPVAAEEDEQLRRATQGAWFSYDIADASKADPADLTPIGGDLLRTTMRQITHELLVSITNDVELQGWLAEHAPQ